MYFYKLNNRSHSYRREQNIFTQEDVLMWASDMVQMNNMSAEVNNNVDVAVEVLDRCGEYLTKVV